MMLRLEVYCSPNADPCCPLYVMEIFYDFITVLQHSPFLCIFRVNLPRISSTPIPETPQIFQARPSSYHDIKKQLFDLLACQVI